MKGNEIDMRNKEVKRNEKDRKKANVCKENYPTKQSY